MNPLGTLLTDSYLEVEVVEKLRERIGYSDIWSTAGSGIDRLAVEAEQIIRSLKTRSTHASLFLLKYFVDLRRRMVTKRRTDV